MIFTPFWLILRLFYLSFLPDASPPVPSSLPVRKIRTRKVRFTEGVLRYGKEKVRSYTPVLQTLLTMIERKTPPLNRVLHCQVRVSKLVSKYVLYNGIDIAALSR